jgi:hypothetical protein
VTRRLTGRARVTPIWSRRTWTELGLALIFFWVLALASTSALLPKWGTRILGAGGDPLGGIWWFWQQANFIGYGLFGSTHISATGAPLGWERGDGINVQSLLVGLPTALAAKVIGPINAYNIMVLSALAFAGTAMFFLVRRLGLSWPVAGWAGVVFAYFPWHTIKANGHGNLGHIALFPLLLAAGIAWFRRPTIPRAMLVAFLCLLLWLTSGYFGVVASVAAVIILAVGIVAHWRVRPRRVIQSGVVLLAGVAGAAVLVFAWATLGGAAGNGIVVRDPTSLGVYGARPLEFIVPSSLNPVVGDWARGYWETHLHGSSQIESALYLGWLTIILATVALVGLVVLKRRLCWDTRRSLILFGATCAVAVACMLPSPVTVFGTEVMTPSALVHQLVPSFRVPTRFMPLLMAALVPFAAVGLALIVDAIRRRWRPQGHAGRWAGLGVCAVAALASFGELTTIPPGSMLDAREPGYVSLVRRAPDGILAQYPLLDHADVWDSDYLFWQQAYRRPLLNSAPAGTLAAAMRDELVDPMRPGTAAKLAGLGVTAVTVRPGEYPVAGAAVDLPRRLGRGFSLLGDSEGVSVWRVSARPAPAVAIPASGFTAPEPSEPGPKRWMTASPARMALYARTAGTVRASFIANSWLEPRTLVIRGESGTRVVRRIPLVGRRVVVDIVVPRGISHVSLDVRPGPTPGPVGDPRTLALYMTSWTIVRTSGVDGRNEVHATAGP